MKRTLIFTTLAILISSAASSEVIINGCPHTQAANGNYFFITDPDCRTASVSGERGPSSEAPTPDREAEAETETETEYDA